ncbi:hypothetical protein ACWCQZ_46710 [Streptomyces sp. NPDC002285]
MTDALSAALVRRDFHPVHDRGQMFSTLYRTLDTFGPVQLDKVATARAEVRSRVHDLLDLRPGGFPWIRGS